MRVLPGAFLHFTLYSTSFLTRLTSYSRKELKNLRRHHCFVNNIKRHTGLGRDDIHFVVRKFSTATESWTDWVSSGAEESEGQTGNLDFSVECHVSPAYVVDCIDSCCFVLQQHCSVGPLLFASFSGTRVVAICELPSPSSSLGSLRQIL